MTKKEEDNPSEEHFDNILATLGLGKWNLVYFAGVGLCGFFVVVNVLGGAFLTPILRHTCIPSENVTDVIQISSCTYTTNTSAAGEEIKKCSSWHYENDTFSSTITSEFNLVCDNNYWRATFQTVYMIGNLFGAPLSGFVSDKAGRRWAIMVGSIVFVTSGVLTTWIQSFTALLTLRFILGVMHPTVLQAGYILCMEICPPIHRSTVGILISLPWALGVMWWGVLGYLIRDWRNLQLAASLSGVIFLFFLCFYNESPRWLIIKGNFEEAYKVLEKAGRWNNKQLPPKDKLIKIMQEIEQASSEKKDINKTETEPKTSKMKNILLQTIVLFRTPAIRKRTLLMYVNFVVASTVYYGLSLNGRNFSADPHVYMILTGLVEVPAYTLTAPIVARLGRRIPTSFCYTFCGVMILVLAFIPAEPAWLMITLAMAGKLFISAAYQIIYLICSEIFPTEIRLQGIGTSNFVARTGAAASPFITDLLGNLYPWAPAAVFGCTSFVAGVSTLFLPETLNVPLPETVYQLEKENKAEQSKRELAKTEQMANGS